MSKDEGLKIAITSTQQLQGDVTGLTPTPIGGIIDEPLDIITILASGTQSNNYDYKKALDGDLTTFWQTSGEAGQNAIVTLEHARPLTRLKIYVGNTTYRPTTITIQGSNDRTTWTAVTTLTIASVLGWQTFDFANSTSYLYYKLLFPGSTNWWIYELQLFSHHAVGNEQAFTISGQEYPMQPEGILSAGDYEVVSVDPHPTITNTLLLILKTKRSFRNVIGALTIAYDAVKGNLAGKGGSVASFSVPFVPTELIQKVSPHAPIHITITNISATGSQMQVYYRDRKVDDSKVTITNMTGSGLLRNINEI